MANEPGKKPVAPQEKPSAQNVPLAKIHDLPGIFIPELPDKAYGGLVSSIQSTGVRNAVILRLREDGEYQLVSGYRRRRASKLAAKKDIPAYIYEMTLKEAQEYHAKVNTHPELTIPGKLYIPTIAGAQDKPAEAPKGKDQPQTAEMEKPAAPAPAKGDAPSAKADPAPKPAEEPKGKDQSQAAEMEKNAAPAPAKGDAPFAKADPAPKPAENPKGKDQSQTTEVEKPAAPAKGDLPPAKADPAPKPAEDPKDKNQPQAAEESTPAAVIGPAAKGPSGTAISQVLDERLSPPAEKDLKDFPSPKEGESIFVVLHPAYLEKSKFNTVSVDQRSEDYKELKKSIELNGVKDPVLARIGEKGTLEILSGQRRHMIATELNYPVPTIIQKISDADAKILVADGNLHRPKISTYDLSRTLRMKMEGMKQKSGRRKKGTVSVEELNSDEKLAAEMGMSVSKLNRIIRLSEASQEVCGRVDDGTLPLSIASAVSFLSQKNQDEVLHLSDLGYKLTNERVERLKKVEKSGKLDEKKMREVLEDKDLAPKQAPAPAVPSAPPATPPSSDPPIPASPDVKAETPPAPVQADASAQTGVSPEPPAAPTPPTGAVVPFPQKDEDITKGEQERPEHTKVILTGDRLRKYFPDVNMTPREIEESVYDALEERRQRQVKAQQKDAIFKKNGPSR